MGLLKFFRRRTPGRITARVIADSVNPDGNRLTTVETTFNRYLLSEVNTHRDFSRNSASSRAIPVRRTMRQVWSDPSYPVSWGVNQAGMQARRELCGWRRWVARQLFLLARIPMLMIVFLLSLIGLHKQVANRLLEPWVWHTAIISATEWQNFFALRLHPDAQPEFQELARCIRTAMDASEPRKLEWGEWHLPYVDRVQQFVIAAETEGADVWRDGPAKVSAACCARVSYVRQNDRRSVEEDATFCNRLSSSGHWSPFEHPAQAVKELPEPSNFRGFRQLRKFYPNESGRSNG